MTAAALLYCLVAIELKIGDFKPKYAGKMDFYLNLLDEHVRLPGESPSIGIILCIGSRESKPALLFPGATATLGLSLG